MFEVGEDTGDQPGELQYWVERDHLNHIYPLPATGCLAWMEPRYAGEPNLAGPMALART